MTRINTVSPKALMDAHLLAELRELTRIPNTIASGRAKVGNIPPTYRLGSGHVSFFYDKLTWLQNRHLELIQEAKARGFKAEDRWPSNLPKHLMNDWEPTFQDYKVNMERLCDRVPANPKYRSKPIKPTFYKDMMK